MGAQHKVEEDEGISSIAEDYGFAPETIWKDDANAELRKIRPDPNVLKPGDILTIPDKTLKMVSKETGYKHCFRRLGIPAIFRMQLFLNREQRAKVDYEINIDGKTTKGQTDEEGVFTVVVPPGARRGELRVGEEPPIEILLGRLQPALEVKGIQQRLYNLSLLREQLSGTLDKETREVLKSFQEFAGLAATGEINQETRERLSLLHDRPKKFEDVEGAQEDYEDYQVPAPDAQEDEEDEEPLEDVKS